MNRRCAAVGVLPLKAPQRGDALSGRVVGNSSLTVGQITRAGEKQSKVRVGGENEAAGAAASFSPPTLRCLLLSD